MTRAPRAAAMAGLALALALVAGPAAAEDAAGFSWIAGHWCFEDQGRRIDEIWLPEAGGELHGLSRTVGDGQVESFEFMRIVTSGDKAGFHAQPNGAAPTLFAIADRGEGWVRFENDAHDFPNVVEYRRDGDRLSAYISGPGPDGNELRIPFEYRACGPG